MENNVKILFDNAPGAEPTGATITEGDKVQIMFDNAAGAAPVDATIVGLPSGGGTKIYEHNIHIVNSGGIYADIYMLSKDDAPFDEKTFIEKVFGVDIDEDSDITYRTWMQQILATTAISARFERSQGEPDDTYYVTLLNLKITTSSGHLEFELAGGILNDPSDIEWSMWIKENTDEYRFTDSVVEFDPYC